MGKRYTRAYGNLGRMLNAPVGRLLASFLISCVLVQAPVTVIAQRPAAVAQQANRSLVTPASHDGELIFRGFFFLSGPIPARVAALQRIERYVPADYKALERPVIRNITATHPGFFEKFAEEMKSNDHVRVAAALKDAQEIQRTALLDVTKGSTRKFDKDLRVALDRGLSVKTRPKGVPQLSQPDVDSLSDVDNNVAFEIVTFVALVVLVVILAMAKDPQAQALKRGLNFERVVDQVVTAMPAINQQLPTLRTQIPSMAGR